MDSRSVLGYITLCGGICLGPLIKYEKVGKYITIPINDSLDLVCLSVCVAGVITVDTLTYCQILPLIH